MFSNGPKLHTNTHTCTCTHAYKGTWQTRCSMQMHSFHAPGKTSYLRTVNVHPRKGQFEHFTHLPLITPTIHVNVIKNMDPTDITANQHPAIKPSRSKYAKHVKPESIGTANREES